MMLKALDIPIHATGVLLERENRFLARVQLENPADESMTSADNVVKAHVHDPGRLRELLFPGNKLLLRRASTPKRKTGWDVIAARFGAEWILINSAYHRKIAEWVFSNPDISPFDSVQRVRAEVKFGHTRLDFVLEQQDGFRTAVETKGCTLAVDKVALFPDAPTVRGTRHLATLTALKGQGLDTAVMILVFRPDAQVFSPFTERDPAFARAFQAAVSAGVKIHVAVFKLLEGAVYYLKSIPYRIKQ